MTEHTRAVPILPVREMAEALSFWSRVPRLAVEAYDDGYAFVRHVDHEVLHLACFPGLDVGANAAGCYLHVAGVDALHAEFVAAALPVSDVADEPWGMREFRFLDPSGNTVRLGEAGA